MKDEGGIEKTAGDIPVTVCKKQEDSHSVAEEQNNQTKDFDDNKKDDVNREKMESENLEIAPDLVHEEKMQQSVNELEAEGTHNFTNDVNHNDMVGSHLLPNIYDLHNRINLENHSLNNIIRIL